MPYWLFSYVVDRRKIVPAGYQAAVAATSGEQLVLSACHPLYSASQRMLVYAHLAGLRPLGAAVDREAATGPTDAQLAAKRKAERLRRLGKRTLVAGMTGP